MSDYHRQWEAAKQTYERSTGASKPAPMGKVPVVGITYRQGTGIDAALEKIDKRIPANLQVGLPPKELARLAEDITELSRHLNPYLDLLERQIGAAKGPAGGPKAPDDRYRHLKILRAEAQRIAAAVTQDMARLRAANESVGQEKQNIYITITALAEGLQNGARKGLLWGQTILAAPSAAAFNSGIFTAARDITQYLANVRKFAIPDSLGPALRAKRDEQVQGANLQEPLQTLYHQMAVDGLRDAVLTLLGPTNAKTAMGASLEELGNKNLTLPAAATAADVVRATKHFIGLAKAALDIGMRMQGIPARMRIPDTLDTLDPSDVAPNYQAPVPPPRPSQPGAAHPAPPSRPAPVPLSQRTAGAPLPRPLAPPPSAPAGGPPRKPVPLPPPPPSAPSGGPPRKPVPLPPPPPRRF